MYHQFVKPRINTGVTASRLLCVTGFDDRTHSGCRASVGANNIRMDTQEVTEGSDRLQSGWVKTGVCVYGERTNGSRHAD